MKTTIDDILREFFTDRLDRTTGIARERVLIVDRALRRCLEQAGPDNLTDSRRVILELERDFNPDDAFARTMDAEDLLFALFAFIREPYLLDNHLERRAQLQLTNALKKFLISNGLLDAQDYACFLLDLEFVLRNARDENWRRGARRR